MSDGPTPAFTTGLGSNLQPAARSIFTRLVLGATLFALASILILFAVTWLQAWESTERSLDLAVDTDIAGLADIYATSGEAELLTRLNDRAALVSMEGRQARYIVQRPGDNAPIGGNITRWPTLAASLSESGFLTLDDGTRVYARATRLSPDLDLAVARTYEGDRVAMGNLVAIFLGVAALIVLAAWLLVRSAAGRLRRRIGDISEALRAAESGSETAIRGDDWRDEIGELARLSTRAIARCAGLARTHRHMSDQIAHEIRTPLSHLDHRLVTALQSLTENSDPLPIQQCRQEIRGVVAMLDSLLDIAASESRVGDLSGLEDVDLSELLEDLAELYTASAEEAGIALRTAVAPDVHIMGERMQLVRLASNLLDNAIKYVPRGGTVRLTLAKGPVIEVIDDGPGIEPALRALVFDRFRTGQPIPGRTSHGLGLALAQAIALRHNMRIALVDSSEGAHFVVKPHAMWPASGGLQ